MIFLSVEDNPVNQLVITNMLKIMGHEVIEASNGQEALDILETRNDFDLIFMDLRMPVMTGREAIIAIRKTEKFDKIPIIVVTASPLDRCANGCPITQDVLGKPFTRKQLEEIVNIWTSIDFLNTNRTCNRELETNCH